MGYVYAIFLVILCLPVLVDNLEAYSQSMLVYITRSQINISFPDYTHFLATPSLAIQHFLGEQVNMSNSQRPQRLISQVNLPPRFANLVEQLQSHNNGRCACATCGATKSQPLREGFAVASVPAPPVITPAIAAPAVQSSPNRAIGPPSATGLVAVLQDKKKHATALRAYLSCESDTSFSIGLSRSLITGL